MIWLREFKSKLIARRRENIPCGDIGETDGRDRTAVRTTRRIRRSGNGRKRAARTRVRVDLRRELQRTGCEAYQLDGVAGPLERVYSGRMRYVDDGHVVHLQYRVVDTQTPVRGRGTARYELGDVNGGVVAVVRIVRAAGDTETEARASPLQNYLFILPVIVAVHLKAQKYAECRVILTVSSCLLFRCK